MSARLPTLYIPHGGGPCFFMEWDPPETWKKMGAWLSQLANTIARPKAIIVVSAHWEEGEFAVMGHPNPSLIFDYSGFPKHTYELTYPAPGSPELAEKVVRLLKAAGIPAKQDNERGFDHGVFIPFKLIYPNANIPVIQLSLKTGLDPAAHIAAGKALASLRDEGVLIVGSGMSYHNLREFFKGGPDVAKSSDQFDAWLNAIVHGSPDERVKSLCDWRGAPSAQHAHPREEHLLPLMVVAGAAGADSGKNIFFDRVMEATVSAFQFG